MICDARRTFSAVEPTRPWFRRQNAAGEEGDTTGGDVTVTVFLGVETGNLDLVEHPLRYSRKIIELGPAYCTFFHRSQWSCRS
jgi:hypothetical protein